MELPPLTSPTNPLRNRLLTAAPDLLIATVYLTTWIAPRLFGDDTVQHLLFIILFEFIILHSASVLVAVLLGGFGDKKGTGCLVVISLFYLVFAVGFSVVIKAWWPVVAIVALTANRVQTLWQKPRYHRRTRTHVIVTWGLTFSFYFFLFIAVNLIPWPRLGIDNAIVDALLAQGSGSMVEAPQTALALGLMYYGGVGLAEGLGLFNKATDRVSTLVKRET